MKGLKMFNPCKNCMVKGNCTTECKTYTKYQKTMANTLMLITIPTTALTFLSLLIFFPSAGFIIWGGSVIFCHIIPIISKEVGFFVAVMIGPFLVVVFILATLTRPYVMRPVEYRKYKKRTKFQRFFGIINN
jgi:membrane protein implicated in regulation of membrane protease activity